MAYSTVEFGGETTFAEASEFREVQMKDYLRIDIPESDARTMAYGSGTEAMLAALAGGEPRYFGLKDGNSLAAVACMSDWLYGDAAPFQSEFSTQLAKLRHRINHKLGRKVVRDSALQVFGVVDNRHYQDEADMLLDHVMEEAHLKGSRYLYAAADMKDEEFVEAFNRKGAWLARGKTGIIEVNGVERFYGLMKADVR